MKSFTEAIYYRSPTLLQNLLVSAYGYKLYHKRYAGSLYRDIMEKVRLSRSWSSEEIEAYQSERLHEMVKHCRLNIPYYQQQFSEHGIHENDITATEHITRLPILQKETLKENSQLFSQPGTKPFMLQHTSGSTGTPLALEVDERTYKLAMALLVDHEETHGVPFGAKRATFAGRMLKPADDMKPPFSRFNRAENQKLFSSYHLNGKTFPHYQKELDQFQPIELIGYPSAIYDLASQYQNSDSKPGFQPKAIITNSESLLVWQRETIESVFGCTVYDYYGTAEYVMFAGQDKAGVYQPNPLIGIAEVDVRSDTIDTGNLLATSLSNRQMPLLRYNLGDTATLANANHPTVGTPTLKSINGRIDDYIETRDGRFVGRIDHIFKGVSGVREAQVVQVFPGSATVKLVKDSSSSFNETSLISNCKQRLGDDFQIAIEFVSEIERGKNGKFRSVVRQK
ncbi:hypothetical protein [Marinobacter salexigens]|uniref:Phenylacetate-CoA ligase n=1 Tax=Marinobacter salexigens TaxID=1925763 RepID=A0ABS6AAX0_9GAMM|nr:hypothetical protein [Marinobacter salexigens]MBU2875234.1 hypothetical protein [Marinobacter salexigens]